MITREEFNKRNQDRDQAQLDEIGEDDDYGDEDEEDDKE